MQQPGAMFPVMPSFPPTSITTEQIQKYLDENKKLILAILDNQNLGKLAECAQYQAQLQKNLMYLAAIADAQPQPTVVPTQLTPHPGMQQGGYYMQHPQAAAMATQPGAMPPRAPFSSPHQLQGLQVLHPLQTLPHGSQGKTPLRSAQNDENHGVSSSSLPSSNAGPSDRHEVSGKDKPPATSEGLASTSAG